MAQTRARGGQHSMADGPWLRVASLKDLAAAKHLRVRPEGRDILLVMLDGEVLACDNTCAHQHFSMLHEGEIRGGTVTCPMHGWRYDLRTGCSETGEGRIATHRVRIAGDDVMVSFG